MSYIHNFMKIYILIYFFVYSFSKIIPPEYNNETVQDPNLDESFSNENGKSFITKGYDKTKFNIVLSPKNALEVYIKIYTDSETLIEALEYGYKLFFGFDFKVHNINSIKEYNTDIIICVFDKEDVNCYDYIYDTKKYKYIRNSNGIISNNFIIPLGFQNLTLNILTKNVIGYRNYYGINFNKKYLEKDQNYTFNNWIKNMRNDFNHKLIGFYGIAEKDEDLIEFSRNFPIYYSSEDNILKKIIISFLKYGAITIFLFCFL